jgi:hypothetical protein
MTPLKPPMLIDAFRLCASSIDDTVKNIVDHYSTAGGGWNHQRCLRSIMHAYNGATDIAALVAGCKGKGTDAERDNAKIVEAVLPKVVGRKTQCFPYPRKTFALTPTLQCTMGPSFFIVENGVIKLVYVHARNEKRASLANLAGLAHVMKTDVLDQDFFGQKSDVEIHFVDKKGASRSDEVYDLKRLGGFLIEEPSTTLKRFATALVDVMENDRVAPAERKRKEKRPTDDGQEALKF